ncbi:MAG TPA: ectoine synthase [Streptosporangiaceae bacterium]|nr:ectoine synthase [Streptosporangiaceae bacterium]
MIVRTLDEVTGTERDVVTPTWRSRRLVLAGENRGFSLHDTVLFAGTETRMWYANHVEAVYVIEGRGELVNEDTGERHVLAPGTMYLLNGHEHHTVRAETDIRTVCAFSPPVTGREVHDENGVYPLIALDGNEEIAEAQA